MRPPGVRPSRPSPTPVTGRRPRRQADEGQAGPPVFVQSGWSRSPIPPGYECWRDTWVRILCAVGRMHGWEVAVHRTQFTGTVYIRFRHRSCKFQPFVRLAHHRKRGGFQYTHDHRYAIQHQRVTLPSLTKVVSLLSAGSGGRPRSGHRPPGLVCVSYQTAERECWG